MAKENVVIRWITTRPEYIEAIREKFNIPQYTTINGLSPALIDESDMEMFKETCRRGFISEMPQKWCKNGDVYIFSSR